MDKHGQPTTCGSYCGGTLSNGCGGGGGPGPAFARGLRRRITNMGGGGGIMVDNQAQINAGGGGREQTTMDNQMAFLSNIMAALRMSICAGSMVRFNMAALFASMAGGDNEMDKCDNNN